MNEDKIIEFLEDFNAKAEKLSDLERIDLLTEMLAQLPDEEQDAILNYCSDAYDEEEECNCCDCEEEIEDEEDNDEMKELKIIEKEIDVALAKLAYEDEVNRLERLNDEAYVSDNTYDGDLYYEGMEQVEVFTSMLKHLLNEGVDYTNAMTITNNFFINKHNIEMSKIQSVGQQMNQI